jgi:hypothetical protein
MSELPDHDRLRELLKRLDDMERESKHLRARIERVNVMSPEWPDRRHRSHLFDEIIDPTAETSERQ